MDIAPIVGRFASWCITVTLMRGSVSAVAGLLRVRGRWNRLSWISIVVVVVGKV